MPKRTFHDARQGALEEGLSDEEADQYARDLTSKRKPPIKRRARVPDPPDPQEDNCSGSYP